MKRSTNTAPESLAHGLSSLEYSFSLTMSHTEAASSDDKFAFHFSDKNAAGKHLPRWTKV